MTLTLLCQDLVTDCCQGCSLGLERLGLETVSRRFFRRLGLVSVSGLERLGLVSVSRQERLGLVSVLSLLRLETQRLARRSHVQYQNS